MRVGPYYRQDSMYYRTQNQMVREFENYMREELEDETFEMPIHKEVCPQCEGKGTMVNRSIDGITQSDRDDWADDDFMEDYMNGVYNVVCDECGGKNVVDVVDEDRLTPEMKKRWREWVKDQNDMVACQLAELRMGA